eukprot:TRINITY_DN59023_c0_g1_i1.p1 TRINITY_DN59023_c0_g1~~TRINITY_DN59023_c0_g1_i1.p1  ORF type:complete len:124 (+),score=34.83 TRINITY_DN59023_c0_g1_i1:46-417(+)
MQRAVPTFARVASTSTRRVPSSALRRNFSAEAAAAGEAAGAKKSGGFFANLPKHPDHEGFEGVLRYYMPTNDKFVVFVLAQYTAVIGFFVMKNKSAAAAAEAAKPPPQYPDFRKALADLEKEA